MVFKVCTKLNFYEQNSLKGSQNFCETSSRYFGVYDEKKKRLSLFEFSLDNARKCFSHCILRLFLI